MDDFLLLLNRISGFVPDKTQKLLKALILFVCVDYITGICVAVKEKKLSSKMGTKGLAIKVIIFLLVFLTAVIDRFLIGEGSALCSVTILFYCSNELISICENATRMGIPLPKKLTSFLKDFKEKRR